jgi:hypothetical protein
MPSLTRFAAPFGLGDRPNILEEIVLQEGHRDFFMVSVRTLKQALEESIQSWGVHYAANAATWHRQVERPGGLAEPGRAGIYLG